MLAEKLVKSRRREKKKKNKDITTMLLLLLPICQSLCRKLTALTSLSALANLTSDKSSNVRELLLGTDISSR